MRRAQLFEPRVEDPAYLAWLRQRGCAFHPDRGAEPHHAIPNGMGGGVQRDDYALPVCRTCHDRCHGATVVELDGSRQLPISQHIQIVKAGAYRRAYLRQRDTPAIPF